MLDRRLEVTDCMDVILEAENKCFPPSEKHFRKEESLLNSSVMVTVESKRELSKSLKLYLNEENIQDYKKLQVKCRNATRQTEIKELEEYLQRTSKLVKNKS